MGVEIRFHGDRTLAAMNRRLQAAVLRATMLVHTQARLLCSRPARRIRRRRARRTAAGPKGSQYTKFIPSAPGASPALRTGFGRSNVSFDILSGGLEGRVGVNRDGRYMAYLELGTRRIAARPWLKPALDAARDAAMGLIREAARLR